MYEMGGRRALNDNMKPQYTFNTKLEMLLYIQCNNDGVSINFCSAIIWRQRRQQRDGIQ